MVKVHPLDAKPYRGFQLGYIKSPNGYKAAWRSSLETKWREGFILVDTIAEVEKLAHECIDFYYLIEAREVLLGRRLTTEEMMEIKNES